eukprot:GHVU01106172.1.p1 GENE.GHVU01106172.1~~GHVU01106172.1.p1  ORF type:complete len:140 (+),score=11.61 GHVU01106172.1:250-669(+)
MVGQAEERAAQLQEAVAGAAYFLDYNSHYQVSRCCLVRVSRLHPMHKPALTRLCSWHINMFALIINNGKQPSEYPPKETLGHMRRGAHHTVACTRVHTYTHRVNTTNAHVETDTRRVATVSTRQQQQWVSYRHSRYGRE